MTIGQRILQARQEAGLSQRELAGENITRNMLSAIEHDKANPSLETLICLSQRLGKPVGWFLGEEHPALEGYDMLRQARTAYDGEQFRECLNLLKEIPEGEVLGREVAMLGILARLSLAEQALADGRVPYARKLLEEPLEPCPYAGEALARQYGILRCRAGLSREIPEDPTMLLRAETALKEKRYGDAVRYLDALDQRGEQWHWLMGEALFGQKAYAKASEHYHAVEKTMWGAVRRKLQLCYAEMKNYEKAYYYATSQPSDEENGGPAGRFMD